MTRPIKIVIFSLLFVLMACQIPGVVIDLGVNTPTPDAYMTAAAGALTRQAIESETAIAQYQGRTPTGTLPAAAPTQIIAPTVQPTETVPAEPTATLLQPSPTFPPPPTSVPVTLVPPSVPVAPTSVPVSPVPGSAPVSGASGPYSFVNLHTQKCLEAPADPNLDNTSVFQMACNGSATQAWRLVPTGDGYYQIISENSAKCLDVEFKHAAENYDLVQSLCNQDRSQRWRFQVAGMYNDILAKSNGSDHTAPAIVLGPFYQIIAQHSNMCVDLDGWSHEDRAHIIHYPCGTTNNDNQLWALK